ncbi:PfkB family carbohydrate kinase [Leucobacter soli]|uniref:PfkB family carbohydrate kinase n=1 Tax=Leucobacter soli TaxID=2812850 RepID=UPI003611DD6C
MVVTIGADGALIADADGTERVAAYPVTAVDTTGAGDAFVGAVAAELAAGSSLLDAVRFATAVSAVSVQRVGAQSSSPTVPRSRPSSPRTVDRTAGRIVDRPAGRPVDRTADRTTEGAARRSRTTPLGCGAETPATPRRRRSPRCRTRPARCRDRSAGTPRGSAT